MKKFLVYFNDKFFYCRRTPAGVVVGTLYNSVGLRMNYLVALEVADRMRAQGYNNVIVVTLLGQPAKPADLEDSTEKILDDIETDKAVREVWESDSEAR